MSKMINMVNEFCQKVQNLCSLDHLIFFKFHQLVVKIFIKNFKIIVLSTSNVGNGNMEELIQRKI